MSNQPPETRMTHDDYPVDWNAWPEGGETFAALARKSSPRLSFSDLRPVAELFYGTPYGADGWQPARGQDPASILGAEGTALALMLQSWGDRSGWALMRCRDPNALKNFATSIRVIYEAIRHYLSTRGNDDGGEQ